MNSTTKKRKHFFITIYDIQILSKNVFGYQKQKPVREISNKIIASQKASFSYILKSYRSTNF